MAGQLDDRGIVSDSEQAVDHDSCTNNAQVINLAYCRNSLCQNDSLFQSRRRINLAKIVTLLLDAAMLP